MYKSIGMDILIDITMYKGQLPLPLDIYILDIKNIQQRNTFKLSISYNIY